MWVLKSLKVIIWGRNITRIRKTFKPQCLSFLFRRISDVCAKILRKTSMVEPFLWLWWLNVELHFFAFLTGKMFRPRISLKIGRFGPGFQWTKCRAIFWKVNQRIFDPFVLSLFSARTFLSGELAILKSGKFRIQIFLLGFISLELHISFNFVNAKRSAN